MLSKTAMALVPAASLVGAAALAPTTSLAQLGENHGFIALNYPYCQELSLLPRKPLRRQVSAKQPSRPHGLQRSDARSPPQAA